MRPSKTLAATLATAALALGAAASPAAADSNRYNHCGQSTQRHFQCVYLPDGGIATCPGGYEILPIESLLIADGNGDGLACAKDGTTLRLAEDAVVS